MTSQGAPYARFQRFATAGVLFHAQLAARELGRRSLADALLFLVLLVEHDAEEPVGDTVSAAPLAARHALIDGFLGVLGPAAIEARRRRQRCPRFARWGSLLR